VPDIPAFCDTCGTAFKSGIFAENVINLTLRGNKAGPCPKCGGMGSIPDGTFNVIGNAIEIISAPERTIEQLKKLADILSIAKRGSVNAEEVTQRIQRKVPELSSLRDILPKTRTELYAFLTLLILAISIIINARRISNTIKINIQNIVNQSVQIVLEQKENTKSE